MPVIMRMAMTAPLTTRMFIMMVMIVLMIILTPVMMV